MVATGGPASYVVELLSCVEILRDARNIRNTDALASDDTRGHLASPPAEIARFPAPITNRLVP
jgi:hypothetical protein